MKENTEDGVAIRDAIGRKQPAVFINESGLYALVLSSKPRINSQLSGFRIYLANIEIDQKTSYTSYTSYTQI